MKRTLLLMLFGFIGLTAVAQQPIEGEIEKMIGNGQYQEVIDKYASADLDHPSETLYFIAIAYLESQDEANGLKYLDLAIAKDATSPAPYYTKGIVLIYSEKPEEAVHYFEKAIELNKDPDKIIQSYDGLGQAYYYMNNFEKALEVYNKMTLLDESDPFAYIVLGQIYAETAQLDKALESYYTAKSMMTPEAERFQNVLFNIALLQHLSENYVEAEKTYRELLAINPEDYHIYAKIIQIQYHNKEYDKALPLKQVLYDAQKENKLPEHMQDMFCIDQFKWKDKDIQVYERYEEGDKHTIYNKILFYILDPEGNIIYRIQTEYSPIAVSLGSGKYILCANKGDNHINYGIGFNDDSSYDSIKNAVIRILENDDDLN